MSRAGTPPKDPPTSPPKDRVESWIFDLDNTLYRATAAMSEESNRLLRGFVAGFLGIDEDAAHRVQKDYFGRYGLTLRGLIVHHGLDPRAYFEHMIQADLSPIRADPRLRAALKRLEGRRIVYTNAFDRHAEAVLERLGIGDLFDVVHDIIAADYVPKPDERAYRDLCRRHGVAPARAVMIDDLPHNLRPAAALGMTTVWLRTGGERDREADGADHIHHVTDDLAEWLEGAADASAQTMIARNLGQAEEAS